MNETPPLPGPTQKRDMDHIMLLAIFHFIIAALEVLAILLLVGHYFIMHAVFTDPQFLNHQTPPPAFLMKIFKCLYVVGGIWFAFSSILNLISGCCLSARKGRTFSLVVAGFNCLHFPFGTVLAIFTFIVLLRDSVRDLYKP